MSGRCLSDCVNARKELRGCNWVALSRCPSSGTVAGQEQGSPMRFNSATRQVCEEGPSGFDSRRGVPLSEQSENYRMPGNRRLPAAPCRVHGSGLGNGESSNKPLTPAPNVPTFRAVEGIRGSRRIRTLLLV